MDFRSASDSLIPSSPKVELHGAESLFECDDGCSMPAGNDHPKQHADESCRNQNGDGAQVNSTAEENSQNTPVMEDTNLLWPVEPFESGEGLPYAPIDWPNPGDTWTWRVGRRVSVAGYYQDRFLYPPKEIVPVGSPKFFASKPACENFIKTNFPGEDHAAFFASFSWKIPSKIPEIPKDAATPEDKTATEKAAAENAEQEVARVSKRGRKLKFTNALIEVDEDEDDMAPQLTQRRRRNSAATPPPANDPSASPQRKQKRPYRRSSRLNEEQQQPEDDPIPENFDDYLNSIEGMLTAHLPASDKNLESCSVADELSKARAKLSSLLALDFPSLVSSKTVSQMVSLASKIRGDPTLTADQLVKLKLIDEIPLFCEVYKESAQAVEEVDAFFKRVEGNKMKISSMKSEYIELKEKSEELQAWVDSSTQAVDEIDNQMEELRSRRAELSRRIEANKAAKLEVVSTQRILASAIPALVQEIQNANANISAMEKMKVNSQKRAEEIMEKFAPLQGFSL